MHPLEVSRRPSPPPNPFTDACPIAEGAKIFTADGSKEIGVVTSGLPSPTLGQNISMGYIQTADGYNKKGTDVLVEVRKKMRKGTVVGMPWITPGYYRG